MSPPLPLPTPSPLSSSFSSFSSLSTVTRFSCLLQFSFQRRKMYGNGILTYVFYSFPLGGRHFTFTKLFYHCFFSSLRLSANVLRSHALAHAFLSFFHLMKFFYVVKFATFSVSNKEKNLCPCLCFPGTCHCQHILCFCIHKSREGTYNALPFRRNEIECGADGFFFCAQLAFILSHRYTRSTICDEWYFDIENRTDAGRG